MLACLVACDSSPESAHEAPALGGGDSPGYVEVAARLDQEVEALARRADAYPRSYLALEALANAQRDAAALSGELSQYVAAFHTIEHAEALAAPSPGPLRSRAHILFSLHLFDDARLAIDEALEGLLLQEGERAALIGLRGEIALHRGNFDAAYDDVVVAHAMRRTTPAAFRVALWHWQTGDFEAAESWVNEAESSLIVRTPRVLSWLDLQRGLLDLDRGRLEEALAHYQDAASAFPGHWLIDEHIAEACASLGATDEAKALYEDLVERTGNPEFMDALASLYRDEGRDVQARDLGRRARAAYEAQLLVAPSAAYAHALSHFLEDPAPESRQRTLALARANHVLRPGGIEAVQLAQALFVSRSVDAAREVIDGVLASSFVHAELFETAAHIARAQGDPRADEFMNRARAINPNIDLSFLN